MARLLSVAGGYITSCAWVRSSPVNPSGESGSPVWQVLRDGCISYWLIDVRVRLSCLTKQKPLPLWQEPPEHPTSLGSASSPVNQYTDAVLEGQALTAYLRISGL